MIPARELFDLRAEWSLDVGVIEKDYVLGWLLAGIANHPDLAATWVFKGGTCLRKCFYETYRFSEDLDFTVVDGGPEDARGAAADLRDDRRMDPRGVRDRARGRRARRSGAATTAAATRQREGRIAYRGPNPPRQLPKVKLDLTADEVVVEHVVQRAIGHQYSDSPAGRRRRLLRARRAVRREVARAQRALPPARPLRRRAHAPPPRPRRSSADASQPCWRRSARTPAIEIPDRRQHPRLALPRRDRARMGEHARPPAAATAAALRRVLGHARRRLRLARGRPRDRRPAPSRAGQSRPRVGSAASDQLLAARLPLRAHPLRRRQPTQGRHRLPGGATADRARDAWSPTRYAARGTATSSCSSSTTTASCAAIGPTASPASGRPTRRSSRASSSSSERLLRVGVRQVTARLGPETNTRWKAERSRAKRCGTRLASRASECVARMRGASFRSHQSPRSPDCSRRWRLHRTYRGSRHQPKPVGRRRRCRSAARGRFPASLPNGVARVHRSSRRFASEDA